MERQCDQSQTGSTIHMFDTETIVEVLCDGQTVESAALGYAGGKILLKICEETMNQMLPNGIYITGSV